jgi:very-short-patch-repair endonuclease
MILKLLLILFPNNKLLKGIWFKKHYSKCESYIERRLYKALFDKGYLPTTQVPCGKYRIDIVVDELAIECDGKDFHSSAKQKINDGKKNKFLKTRGYSVLRFTGSEINTEIRRVISKIEQEL